MPFDKFGRELISPVPESEGFIQGIVWRGAVNASQTPQMQAAQNISQVFMGVNLKCASCPDSFINEWILPDSYGMGSNYFDTTLQLLQFDKTLRQTTPLKVLSSAHRPPHPTPPQTALPKQLAVTIIHT